MASRTETLEARLAAMARETGFAGAVRVRLDGGEVFEAAYGLAERTHGIANTVDTRFGIASGGKLFTALGIGVLLDGGSLALDARLVEALEMSVPKVSQDVTIAQLLTHTSGVYDYYDEERIDDFDAFELPIAPHRLLTPADYLPMLASGEMKFSPGARSSYSNSGYVLLGALIAELSPLSYHRFITEQVLRRCGATSSGFFRFDQLPAKVATGYIESAAGWRTNIYQLPIIGGPDGGAFCTVSDMERVWQTLLRGQLLSAALTARYLRPAAHYKDHIFYGHGLWIHDDGDEPAYVYAEGSDAGVSFQSRCYADTVVATVMSNSSDGAWAMSDAAHRLVLELVPRQFRHVGARSG